MSSTLFGIDFGTTNSLAALVAGGRALALVDQSTLRPHPSVIWYRGSDTVVGQEARRNMDLTEGGAPPGFVRSPKMALRRDGPIFVDGQPVDPTDAVAEVLRHLARDAALPRGRAPGQRLQSAVMTIPVNFGGPERRALRQAARKAGISVAQFVHEPVAALYAYLRAQPEPDNALARLEGRSVLVFDWGGGTLDLTLCRIQGGAIMQIANLGDNEVGGDRFDERLRNLLRSKHSAAHSLEDISNLEQAGVAAKLLHQCEVVKINLSDPKKSVEDVIIRDFLKIEGRARNLVSTITRDELNRESASIVSRGLARIDEILESARLTYQDIELCLATGGMVNMPAIREGLVERFLGRVPKLVNGDRIIAEGAAWIAHDGLRLTLSKPIEILVADTGGIGTYYPLVRAGWQLPLENETQNVSNTRLFCTDPREGVALVEIAKPTKIGRVSAADPRRTLCVASVAVDPEAEPLIERLECHLQIDHDYIANLTLRSTGRGDQQTFEFYDLEFGLALPARGASGPSGENDEDKEERGRGSARFSGIQKMVQRTNVAMHFPEFDSRETLWSFVPGDLVSLWRPAYFDVRGTEPTEQQILERNFYTPCARCGRLLSKIRAEGPSPECTDRCRVAQRTPHAPASARSSSSSSN
jgi:molecular chaperone DnaK